MCPTCTAPSYGRDTMGCAGCGAWHAHDVGHIARHGVAPNEVEEVVRTDKARWFTDDAVRLGRLVVIGPPATGVSW